MTWLQRVCMRFALVIAGLASPILRAADPLVGAKFSNLSREDQEIETALRYIVDPATEVRGVWDQVQRLQRQDFESRWGSSIWSITTPADPELQKHYYRILHDGNDAGDKFLKAQRVEALRDRASHIRFGVAPEIFEYPSQRLDRFRKSHTRRYTRLEAERDARIAMGMGEVANFDLVLAEDPNLNRIYLQQVMALEDSDIHGVGTQKLDFEKWKVQETALVNEQIERLRKAQAYLLAEEFPDFLSVVDGAPHSIPEDVVPKVYHGATRPFRRSDIENSKLVFPGSPHTSSTWLSNLALLDSQSGSVKTVVVTNPMNSRGEKYTISGGGGHDYYYRPRTSEYMTNPEKTKFLSILETYTTHIEALENHQKWLAKLFPKDELEISHKMRLMDDDFRDVIEGSVYLLDSEKVKMFFAGLERHGGDLAWIQKKESRTKSAPFRKIFYESEVSPQRAQSFSGSMRPSSASSAPDGTPGSAGPSHPPAGNGRASNPGHDMRQNIFEVKEIARHSAPDMFWSSSIRSVDPKLLVEMSVAPGGESQYRVKSLTPLPLEGSVLSIPTGSNAELSELVVHDAAGRKLEANKDFRFLRNKDSTEIFLRFNDPALTKVSVQAGFTNVPAPKKVPHPSLEKMNRSTLRDLASELDRAGLLPMAQALRHLIAGDQPIGFIEVADMVERNTLYSMRIVKNDATGAGPFADYTRFLNAENFPCVVCNGSDALLRDFMNEYFSRRLLPFRAQSKTGYRLVEGKLQTPGHVVTAIVDDRGLEMMRADATASRRDPLDHTRTQIVPIGEEIERPAEEARADIAKTIEHIRHHRNRIVAAFSNPAGVRNTVAGDPITDAMRFLRSVENELIKTDTKGITTAHQAEATRLSESLDKFVSWARGQKPSPAELEKYLNNFSGVQAVHDALGGVYRGGVMSVSAVPVATTRLAPKAPQNAVSTLENCRNLLRTIMASAL